MCVSGHRGCTNAYQRRVLTRVLSQDAASLCDTCSADIHAANPLAGRHVLEAVQPVSATPMPFVLEGTRVAASANAAEIEEYRRQCEALLNNGGEETPESTRGGPPAGPTRTTGAAAALPPGMHLPLGGGLPTTSSAVSAGGAGAQSGDGAGLGLPDLEPLDLFGPDFGDLDSDMPLEFAFLEAHGACWVRVQRFPAQQACALELSYA